ncbi:hypothetical protein PSJ72_26735 [Escherichia coli]|nr:hypothetical protein [Escherichia coli]
MKKDGDIKGSYFLCNGKQIGIMARRSYPLSSDEVLIPFFPHMQDVFFPDKTNKLSIINKQNIINATWKIARKKKNCIIKESFFHLNLKKTRRNEIQRFIRNGGEIKCISQLSDKEISSSYISLFSFPVWRYPTLLRI